MASGVFGGSGKVFVGEPPAGSTALSPGIGAIAFAGLAPTLQSIKSLAAGAPDAVAFTGYAPALINARVLSPSPASIAITGLAPTLRSVRPAGAPDSIAFTGLAPTLKQTLVPAPDSVAFTGFAPSLSSAQNLSPAPDSVAFTGLAPSLRVLKLAGAPGSVSFSGFAPALLNATILFPGADSIAFTGLAPSLHAIPPLPPGLRVDFYDTGENKLDIPPLFGTAILSAHYKLKLNQLGEWSMNIPTDHIAGASIESDLRAYIYVQEEGLCFRGIVRKRSEDFATDGKMVLTISGPSLGDELQRRSTGVGLQFVDATITDVVDAIIDDTAFVTGEIDSPGTNIAIRDLTGFQKWDALVSVSDAWALNVREDHLVSPPEIDMGAFGDPSGLIFTNRRTDLTNLRDHPELVPLKSLRLSSQVIDLANYVVGRAQVQGLGAQYITLKDSTRGRTETRFYLPSSGAAPISPAPDAGWERTADMDRVAGARWKTGTAPLVKTATKATSSGSYDSLARQYIIGPLKAQTIAGNVIARIAANESDPAAEGSAQIGIRIVAPDATTFRGTALALSAAGLSNEFSDSGAATRDFPIAGSADLAPVVAQDGDYMVIEIGARGRRAAATLDTFSFVFGDSSPKDLDDDVEINLAPWIEFDSCILFPDSGEEYRIQHATVNGKEQFFLSDAASIAAREKADRLVEIKGIVSADGSPSAVRAAANQLYDNLVTFLKRHLDELTAYEAEPIGLRHIVTGIPTFEVGQTVRVQFRVTTVDADGSARLVRDVDAQQVIMDAERTFDAAGASSWRFTLSSVAREMPNDGNVIAGFLKGLNAIQSTPLQALVFGGDPPVGRITESGLALLSPDDPGIGVNSPRTIRWYSDTNFSRIIGEIASGYESGADGSGGFITPSSPFHIAQRWAPDSYMDMGYYDFDNAEWKDFIRLNPFGSGFGQDQLQLISDIGSLATLFSVRQIDTDRWALYVRNNGSLTKVGGTVKSKNDGPYFLPSGNERGQYFANDYATWRPLSQAIAPSAAPTVTSSVGGLGSVAMPASVAQHDLLLVFCATIANGSHATPSGWTKLEENAQLGGGFPVTGAVFYKDAAGTEGGTTLNFSAGSVGAIAHVYKIPAGAWAGSPAVSADKAGTVSTANPDPATFVGRGLAFNFAAANNTTAMSAGTNATHSVTASGSDECACSTDYRCANYTSSFDGAGFGGTLTTWVAYSVVVRAADNDVAEDVTVTNLHVSPATTPDYIVVELATGAPGAESSVGEYKYIPGDTTPFIPIDLPSGTRISARIGGGAAYLSLQLLAQDDAE